MDVTKLSMTFIILSLYFCGYFKLGVSSTLYGDPDIKSGGLTKVFDVGSKIESSPLTDHAIKKRSVNKEPIKSNVTSKVSIIVFFHFLN